jgi:hypothetical protein
MMFDFSTGIRNYMDENYQDNAGSKLTASEIKIWLPPSYINYAEPQSQSDKSNLDPTVIISVYQVIACRRLGYDTSMWQAPVLSFTAQAFLFTIALNVSVSNHVTRSMAALLALIIALISMQLMSKHRYHERIDAKLLENLEKEMKLDKLVGYFPHGQPEYRARLVGMKPQWLQRPSSYRVWMLGLALFAIASVIIIIITFTNPALLR